MFSRPPESLRTVAGSSSNLFYWRGAGAEEPMGRVTLKTLPLPRALGAPGGDTSLMAFVHTLPLLGAPTPRPQPLPVGAYII